MATIPYVTVCCSAFALGEIEMIFVWLTLKKDRNMRVSLTRRGNNIEFNMKKWLAVKLIKLLKLFAKPIALKG